MFMTQFKHRPYVDGINYSLSNSLPIQIYTKIVYCKTLTFTDIEYGATGYSHTHNRCRFWFLTFMHFMQFICIFDQRWYLQPTDKIGIEKFFRNSQKNCQRKDRGICTVPRRWMQKFTGKKIDHIGTYINKVHIKCENIKENGNGKKRAFLDESIHKLEVGKKIRAETGSVMPVRVCVRSCMYALVGTTVRRV